MGKDTARNTQRLNELSRGAQVVSDPGNGISGIMEACSFVRVLFRTSCKTDST